METESIIPNPGVECEIYGSSPGKGTDGSILTVEILRLGIFVVWLSLCSLFSLPFWLQTLYCLVNLLRGSLPVDEARGMCYATLYTLSSQSGLIITLEKKERHVFPCVNGPGKHLCIRGLSQPGRLT